MTSANFPPCSRHLQLSAAYSSCFNSPKCFRFSRDRRDACNATIINLPAAHQAHAIAARQHFHAKEADRASRRRPPYRRATSGEKQSFLPALHLKGLDSAGCSRFVSIKSSGHLRACKSVSPAADADGSYVSPAVGDCFDFKKAAHTESKAAPLLAQYFTLLSGSFRRLSRRADINYQARAKDNSRPTQLGRVNHINQASSSVGV